MPPQPPRPTLQDMSCQLIDVVLAAGFDWMELTNLIDGAAAKVRGPLEAKAPCWCVHLPRSEQPLHVVHGLCHSNPGFAAQLQRQLDCKHHRCMLGVAAHDACELRGPVLREKLSPHHDLAGFAWALARDPRPEIQALVPPLLSRIHHDCLRAYLAPALPKGAVAR